MGSLRIAFEPFLAMIGSVVTEDFSLGGLDFILLSKIKINHDMDCQYMKISDIESKFTVL